MSWLATQKWTLNGKEITLHKTFDTQTEARRWATQNTLKCAEHCQMAKEGFSVAKEQEGENVPA